MYTYRISNPIVLLIQATPVSLKELTQCVLIAIHIPRVKDVINPTTCTYNIDIYALTVNIFKLCHNKT